MGEIYHVYVSSGGDGSVLLALRGGGGVFAHPSRLLGEQNGLYVGENAALRDGHSMEQFVELLVVAYCQLQMARVDPLLLVVTGRVASQLEDLGGEVFHDGCQVDWSARSHPLSVVSLAEETVDTSYGKLEPSAGGAGLGLCAGFAAFSPSRHGDIECSSGNETLF